MSGSEEAERPEREALAALERAVGRLLAEVEAHEVRTRRAEVRVRDVEALLRRFTKGEDDPARLQARLTDLEEENTDLKARMEEARESVDRLLARIRFLEEQG